MICLTCLHLSFKGDGCFLGQCSLEERANFHFGSGACLAHLAGHHASAQQPLLACSLVREQLSCTAKSIEQCLGLLSGCSFVADPVHTLVLQVKDSQALYRSDFFPGLGWMTNQQVWQGLRCIYLRA